MKRRKRFALHKRKRKGAKAYYYYTTYDQQGKLTKERSTGQTTKTAAEAYCNELDRRGLLIPGEVKTFLDYAENWWIWDKCDYIKDRIRRKRNITPGYADVQRGYLKNHITPTFGKYLMDRITPSMIDDWLFYLIGPEKKLAQKTANNILGCLQTMLSQAVKREIIRIDPAAKISRLAPNSRPRSILTEAEAAMVFDRKHWKDQDTYVANMLAACTGMRLGEVQALRWENVHSGYIHVCHSWARKYQEKIPKTASSFRNIRIISALYELLHDVSNGSGYIFSRNGGTTPLYHTTITRALYKAMKLSKIDEKERKRRNVSFHSWRHFFNTIMRDRVDDVRLRLLTGHSSQEMTTHYDHQTGADVVELDEYQTNILAGSSHDNKHKNIKGKTE